MYGILTVTREQLLSFQLGVEPPKDLPATEYRKWTMDRQKQLALDFRVFMTGGQSFGTVNANRKEFYTRVVDTAKEVRFFLLDNFL